MPKNEPVSKEPSPVKYKTESLLNSKAFAEYQPDFARALLQEPEYTIDEAKKQLDEFYKEKEGI